MVKQILMEERVAIFAGMMMNQMIGIMVKTVMKLQNKEVGKEKNEGSI